MVLVDPKMLAGLSQAAPPVSDPLSDVLKRLDNDMENVLTKRETPLDTKLDLYNQVLTQYLSKVREYKGYSRAVGHHRMPLSASMEVAKEPEGEGSEDGAWSPEVSTAGEGYLSMITPRYRAKVQRVLNFLKSVPDVSWSPLGELKLGDRTIADSHAVDLLSAAVKPESRSAFGPGHPAGWSEFAGMLKKYNAPKDMVGAAMRKAWRSPSFALGTSPPGQLGDNRRSASRAKKRRRLVASPRSPIGGPGVRWESSI